MARKSNNTCLNEIANASDSFYGSVVSKSITYVAATTGATGATTLFSVSGLVAMQIVAVCNTTLTGSGKLEVGTALDTDGIIAKTTGTAIDVNEIWHDNSPDNSIEAVSVATKNIVNQDVIQTISTDTITAGKITYYCFWKPLSSGASVVSA